MRTIELPDGAGPRASDSSECRPLREQVAGLHRREVGAMRPLFDMFDARAFIDRRWMYDVTPDGDRFLVNTLAEQAASAPITLVVNWPALLK